MVASRDENKPPNKLVVYPLTVPSGRGGRLSSLSQKGGLAESDAGYAGWMVPTESDEEMWRASPDRGTDTRCLPSRLVSNGFSRPAIGSAD